MLTWGVFVGIGAGCTAMVLSATVATRWFTARRGLVVGLLASSVATGQMIFLPVLASVVGSAGWRPAVLIVAAVAAAMIPVVFFLLPERPADIGLRPYGETAADPVAVAARTNPLVASFKALRRGIRSRDFWLLAGSFFVCGLSTNGLIGTHLIATCVDHGIPEFTGAEPARRHRHLRSGGNDGLGLAHRPVQQPAASSAYYGFRGLSLIYLAFSDYSFFGLSIFAVFYGLDWVATLPPTVRLTNDAFGREEGPIMFGWIMAAHQVGAAVAAFGAGVIRTELDGYLMAFVFAGAMCMMTAVLVLGIGARRRRKPARAGCGVGGLKPTKPPCGTHRPSYCRLQREDALGRGSAYRSVDELGKARRPAHGAGRAGDADLHLCRCGRSGCHCRCSVGRRDQARLWALSVRCFA